MSVFGSTIACIIAIHLVCLSFARPLDSTVFDQLTMPSVDRLLDRHSLSNPFEEYLSDLPKDVFARRRREEEEETSEEDDEKPRPLRFG